MTFGTGNLAQGTDPFVAVKQFELTAIFHSVRTEEFWLEERRCSIEGIGSFYDFCDTGLFGVPYYSITTAMSSSTGSDSS